MAIQNAIHVDIVITHILCEGFTDGGGSTCALAKILYHYYLVSQYNICVNIEYEFG